MSDYKNKLNLHEVDTLTTARQNLVDDVLLNGTPMPKSVGYGDIDTAFKYWVENELNVSYEGRVLPTLILLSGQRFSEYAQSWEHLDEDRNLLMNFKAITRETNPQKSGNSIYNIPGEHHYLIERREILEKNGLVGYVDYKMKQPMWVDLIYKVTFVTNKLDLLNTFNSMVNNSFKSVQSYIKPNGHFMSMLLESISDESEYSVDDRRYFTQTFNIKVTAYIINSEDLIVEEVPSRVLLINDGVTKTKAVVEIEDDRWCKPIVEDPFYYQAITLTIKYHICSDISKFTIDTDMVVTNILLNNVRSYTISLNDRDEIVGELFSLKKGDYIKIKIIKFFADQASTFILKGYNPNVIFDKNLDNPEDINDATQHEISKEIN